jgi:limonene-1,2-epoxide hydrolase
MSDETFEASRRALMGGGAAGLAMLGLFASKAQAQTQKMTPQEAANVKVVNDFLKAGEKPKDAAAGLPWLATDAAYRMTEAMPWDKGHEAIVARLKPFVDNADKIEFKVLKTAVAGPIVINHRIDTFTSTTRPLLFEGVGVFFIKNGKIQEWTDYTIRAALSNTWPKT